jgi:hypothetical protein
MDTLIPAFLRRQRNQRRLTLEMLSAKVGMSPQHLSEIESGKRDPRLSCNARCQGGGRYEGRNNWLFAGSLRGGERAAAVMSLVHSARLNGLDPLAYLTDVLERLKVVDGNCRFLDSNYLHKDNMSSRNRRDPKITKFMFVNFGIKPAGS